MEREGGDVAMPDVIVPPPPPTSGTQDEQSAAPPVQPAGDVVVTDLTHEVRTPARRRLAKAASTPRPLEAGAASSSVPHTEATSAAPAGWVRGGGTGALAQASLDVQAKLWAEAEALKRCNEVFLESWAAIRDYHNLRAVTFNSRVRELETQTTHLSESQKANATLQQQLGEANTALRGKEAECSKLAEERDRLVTQLAEQVEALKTAQREAKAKETDLLAEFEIERSAWADKEAQMMACFSSIEDLVEYFFPGYSVVANQIIEAQHKERRAEGVQIPGVQAPRTPSRTADWLEVAAGRLEAWKGSAARAGAHRALEFVKAWYPGLDLAQLTMFRLEAREELAVVEAELINKAAAIADFTDTSVFIPEVVEEGAEAPLEWLGLNPEDSEDSAEVFDSSDEGEEEEEEEEESEDDMPEVGADGQPQPDQASSNDPRSKVATAAGSGQAETDQPLVPPTDVADSAIRPSAVPTGATESTAQPEPPAAPTGTTDSIVQPEPSAAPTGTADPNVQPESSAAP
nr:eukaryotic translation initiation factor 5B-like [Aegilops tauschii subsp. strangulata]